MELEFGPVMALEKRRQQMTRFWTRIFNLKNRFQRILNNQVDSITNSRHLQQSIS